MEGVAITEVDGVLSIFVCSDIFGDNLQVDSPAFAEVDFIMGVVFTTFVCFDDECEVVKKNNVDIVVLGFDVISSNVDCFDGLGISVSKKGVATVSVD